MRRRLVGAYLVTAVLCLLLFSTFVAHASEEEEDPVPPGLLTFPFDSPFDEDLTPPSLLEFTFEPYWADTSDAAQVITVTAHITDDLSGVAYGFANFSAERAPAQGAYVEITETQRVSGTPLDGVYQITFTLPQYSAYGRWTVSNLCMFDQLRNSNCGYASYPPSQSPLQYTPWFWNGYSGYYFPLLSGPPPTLRCYVSPEAYVGGDIYLSVYGFENLRLSRLEFGLQYPPGQFEFNDQNPERAGINPFFGPTDYLIVEEDRVDPAAGEVHLAIGQAGDELFQISGVWATARALTPGTATLAFFGVRLIDSAGNDVRMAVENCSVNVWEMPPSPLPTPTPFP